MQKTLPATPQQATGTVARNTGDIGRNHLTLRVTTPRELRKMRRPPRGTTKRPIIQKMQLDMQDSEALLHFKCSRFSSDGLQSGCVFFGGQANDLT